eukprot:14825193-Heterocapsa_arctica.AAC.1
MQLTAEWATSKAHIKVKLQRMSSFIKEIADLELVGEMVASALKKHRRLLSAQMWAAGTVNGRFNMDSLTGILRGYA